MKTSGGWDQSVTPFQVIKVRLQAREFLGRYKNSWDALTNAPSHNFVYDFRRFRFFVRDEWRQVCATAVGGEVLSGSVEALAAAFAGGCEVKVGISGLCVDLGEGPGHVTSPATQHPANAGNRCPVAVCPAPRR